MMDPFSRDNKHFTSILATSPKYLVASFSIEHSKWSTLAVLHIERDEANDGIRSHHEGYKDRSVRALV